jgi:hypothetical protein
MKISCMCTFKQAHSKNSFRLEWRTVFAQAGFEFPLDAYQNYICFRIKPVLHYPCYNSCFLLAECVTLSSFQ